MHCGHWDRRSNTGSIGVTTAAAADDTDVVEIAIVGVGVKIV